MSQPYRSRATNSPLFLIIDNINAIHVTVQYVILLRLVQRWLFFDAFFDAFISAFISICISRPQLALHPERCCTRNISSSLYIYIYIYARSWSFSGVCDAGGMRLPKEFTIAAVRARRSVVWLQASVGFAVAKAPSPDLHRGEFGRVGWRRLRRNTW